MSETPTLFWFSPAFPLFPLVLVTIPQFPFMSLKKWTQKIKSHLSPRFPYSKNNFHCPLLWHLSLVRLILFKCLHCLLRINSIGKVYCSNLMSWFPLLELKTFLKYVRRANPIIMLNRIALTPLTVWINYYMNVYYKHACKWDIIGRKLLEAVILPINKVCLDGFYCIPRKVQWVTWKIKGYVIMILFGWLCILCNRECLFP